MKTSRLQKIGRILLGSAMVVAGIAHLTFQRKGFRAQVPRWLPSDPRFMDRVVLVSGVVEIAFGLSVLFWKDKRPQVGMALAIFYVLIFPGNISQYQNHISALGLDTDRKRFVRLFFQPVLIYWALWSTGTIEKLSKNTKSLFCTEGHGFKLF